jgi:hypothetical protein
MLTEPVLDEAPSKMAVSPLPGTEAPEDPPDVSDQLEVEFQLQVEPDAQTQ